MLERYYPIGGIRIEDDILVTATGYESLTTAPKGEEACRIIRGEDRGLPPPYTPSTDAASPSHGPRSNPTNTASKDEDANVFELQFQRYHASFQRYLAASLKGMKPNARGNRACDKLTKLTYWQLNELSVDVLDDLNRRQAFAAEAEAEIPFLPPQQHFHPRRNQARQKLSTLPANRFRDLVTDTHYETERRYPKFAGAKN
jgi:Spa2 homology domain (SHD) of GIT